MSGKRHHNSVPKPRKLTMVIPVGSRDSTALSTRLKMCRALVQLNTIPSLYRMPNILARSTVA